MRPSPCSPARALGRRCSDLPPALSVPPGRVSVGSRCGAGLRAVCFLLSQTNMPFLSIYLLALEQDMEHGTSVLQAANTLQHQTFLQVSGRRAVRLSRRVLPGSWAVRRPLICSVLLPQAAPPQTGSARLSPARARRSLALHWPRRIEPRGSAASGPWGRVRTQGLGETPKSGKANSTSSPLSPRPRALRAHIPRQPPPSRSRLELLSGAVCPGAGTPSPVPALAQLRLEGGCQLLSVAQTLAVTEPSGAGSDNTRRGELLLAKPSAKGGAVSVWLRPPWGLSPPSPRSR